MSELETAVEEQLETLERELSEIDMLLQQTRDEAERHAQRLKETSERLPALAADPSRFADELREAQTQVLTLTRRATLMEGQVQVLEGKQKTLRRFVDFIVEVRPQLSSVGGVAPAANEQGPSRAVLAAQEEMRREIARRMHDGPAQAIANIALQAQLVRRLAAQDPAGSQGELDRLGEMVQHALDATKGFIFDVRPMVLDDLGLVATLRRMATERTRHSGVPVRFESTGQDRRLPEEIESSLFRIVDDAVGGFVSVGPAEVTVRLDWSATDLRAHIESHRPSNDEVPDRVPTDWPQTDAADLPPALASVMQEQRAYEEAKAARALQATALPESVWADVSARSAAMGLAVQLSADGHALAVTLAMAA